MVQPDYPLRGKSVPYGVWPLWSAAATGCRTPEVQRRDEHCSSAQREAVHLPSGKLGGSRFYGEHCSPLHC